MKVLYYCQLDKDRSPGVYNKVISKVHHLRSQFPVFDVLAISDPAVPGSSYFTYQSKRDLAEVFHEAINSLDLEYDVIIMRYPRLSKRFFKALKKYPNKVIFEHNTLERNELWFNISSLTIRDFIYLLLKDRQNLWRNYLQPYVNEVIYGKKILSLALAGICVSDSVRRHEKKRYGEYKTLTQGNGVELSEVSLRKTPLDFSGINLMFVSGSSNKWHGIDRLIRGIYNYKGVSKITLHIVGKVHHSIENDLRTIEDKCALHRHGVLDRSELSVVSERCNIGVGSLGLHRLEMYEGSTLKVREYMAMGLPFMLSYNDIDVDASYGYCLRYPANDSPVDLRKVDDFLIQLKNMDFKPQNMRTESQEIISQKVKMCALSAYLTSLV